MVFIIHKILDIVSAVFIIDFISFGSFGIFGAGGKTGSSNLTVGITDGISGNFGGAGIIGTAGIDGGDKLRPISSISWPIRSIPKDNDSSISTEISKVGGSGKFGSFGKGTEIGTKLNFGNVTSIHKFSLEKSNNILGILNGGISITGIVLLPPKLHKTFNLQLYWS